MRHAASTGIVCVLLAAAAASACAARSEAMRPGRPCPSRRVDNYLVPRWQQCWFSEAGGRWRTLDHTLHYSVLVVQVEATNLDLAGAIARRFVERHGERFDEEILIYVHQAPATASGPTRRVSWTPNRGYQVLDIAG